MTSNKPNSGTRAWAGKEDKRNRQNWKPFEGKFKVIKLPRHGGSIDGRSLDPSPVRVRLDQRWIDF